MEKLFVEIDAGWARLPEVDAYAEAHGMTRGEAIVDLANAGLSNDPRSWIDRR